MSRRFRGVHVLVVAGDGTRVVRVALPRRLMRALALIVLIGVGGSIGLLVDNVSLRRQAQHRPAAVPTVVADAAPAREETQAQLDAVRARLASMRSEIASWNELHAGIWRPLGPDAARGRAATGVGGAAAAVASASPVPLPIEAQLTRIAESLAEERQRLQALAKFMAGPGSMLRMLPSHWPLRGAVNSEFGRRLSPWSEGTEFHGGIDIAARPGTSVKAPAPGTVRFAGHSPGYGTTVILDHGREVQTLFGHLRDIGVRAGQRVERGQAIATSGDSGRATGPHLHYEILVQGRPVNPRGYLWE